MSSLEITAKAKLFAARHLGCSVDELEVRSVSGGYSRNRKGVVGANGEWLFVKEVDIDLLPDDGSVELGWLKKEHELMRYLAANQYDVVPDWCELSDDSKVLLLPAYRAEDGWLWGYPSDVNERFAYVDAVIRAVKRLEGTSFPQADIETYKLQPFFRDELAFDEGFDLLINNEVLRDKVADKVSSMANSQHSRLLNNLKDLVSDRVALERLSVLARQLADRPNDAFGHCDVRSDNLTYHPGTGQVKLIDWNWASFTPTGLGATEFLTDAARHGVDISPWLQGIDVHLLAALVGFYARRCTKDPLLPGDTLREMQAESAAIVYDMYRSISQD